MALIIANTLFWVHRTMISISDVRRNPDLIELEPKGGPSPKGSKFQHNPKKVQLHGTPDPALPGQ